MDRAGAIGNATSAGCVSRLTTSSIDSQSRFIALCQRPEVGDKVDDLKHADAPRLAGSNSVTGFHQVSEGNNCSGNGAADASERIGATILAPMESGDPLLVGWIKP